jgi:hypothetical protein
MCEQAQNTEEERLPRRDPETKEQNNDDEQTKTIVVVSLIFSAIILFSMQSHSLTITDLKHYLKHKTGTLQIILRSTMFEFQQKQSTTTPLEGRELTWWYPIQSTPSQDMWELPITDALTTSVSIRDGHEEHDDFSPRLRRDETVEVFSLRQNTGTTYSWSTDDASNSNEEENNIIGRDSRGGSNEKKREVLGDATNTIRRRSMSSLINSTSSLRRSNFA